MNATTESISREDNIFFLGGKHAVVSGASRGIGAAIAVVLARLGADVTLMSHDERRLQEQAATLAKIHNGKAQVTSLREASAAFEEWRATTTPCGPILASAG